MKLGIDNCQQRSEKPSVVDLTALELNWALPRRQLRGTSAQQNPLVASAWHPQVLLWIWGRLTNGFYRWKLTTDILTDLILTIPKQTLEKI